MPRIVSLGVLNMTATRLPQPAYPLAAKLDRASGEVRVHTMVDEEGNVVSAKATSGNSVLRRAAENAAWQAKFEPVLLSGQKVKMRGVLIYHFYQ